MRGTEFQRLITFPFNGVDGKDATCAAVHRAQHGGHPDAAQPDDRHVVTGPHLGRPGRRPESRCHTTADERRSLERYGWVDLHQRCLMDHDVGGEGAQQCVGVHVAPIGLDAKSPVRNRSSGHQPHTQVAQIALTGVAGWTFAARWDERRRDMVTHREVVDAFADLDDDAGAFVAAQHGKGRHGDVAGHHVMLGMAQPRGFHPDLDLALRGSPMSISSTDHG